MVDNLGKGRRVVGGERKKLRTELKREYSAGRSIRDLAAETGRSYGFVHGLLVESGVKLRGRGGPTRAKKKR